ncbi:NXPE family member 4-like [Protopterus annectens]|uniref:NXPE family member 4-like n=1 Tax=Protopterus annectens TaxID=7888 RepID=UPI001CFC04B5|nr:NXPE family member 4-like [Protopterus annectens]
MRARTKIIMLGIFVFGNVMILACILQNLVFSSEPLMYQKCQMMKTFHQSTGLKTYNLKVAENDVIYRKLIVADDVIYRKLVSDEPPFHLMSFNSSTSAKKSGYVIISSNTYMTGDTLNIYVQTYDQLGSLNTFYGDFFRARIFNNHLNASVSGIVTDFKNGSYIISFPLLWPGAVVISVKLMHSGQAVAFIRQGRELYPHKISFKGIFQSNGKEEITDCHFNLSYYGPLCDLSNEKAGVTWFCEKPKSLQCDNLKFFYSYNKINYKLSKEEENILDSKLFGEEITPLERSSITVQSKKDFKITASPCIPKPYMPQNITGFVLNNTWTSLQCRAQNFATPQMAAKCLRGKKVYFLGDSTTRQWWEYLISFIPSLKAFNFMGKQKNFEHLATDITNNIYLRWTAHGAPFTSTSKYPYTNLHPVSQEIDFLNGGKDYVVVIGLGAHFTAFPLQIFIQRLLSIRSALERLIARNPDTVIILKNVNTRDINSFVMANSDWLSFEFNRAINEVFQGMKVVLINAWDITVAFDSFRIHPLPSVIKSEVDLFLSYVCPRQ